MRSSRVIYSKVTQLISMELKFKAKQFGYRIHTPQGQSPEGLVTGVDRGKSVCKVPKGLSITWPFLSNRSMGGHMTQMANQNTLPRGFTDWSWVGMWSSRTNQNSERCMYSGRKDLSSEISGVRRALKPWAAKGLFGHHEGRSSPRIKSIQRKPKLSDA